MYFIAKLWGFCAGAGLVLKKNKQKTCNSQNPLSIYGSRPGSVHRNLRSEEESHNASSAKVHLATEPFLPLLSNLSNYFLLVLYTFPETFQIW